MSKKKKFRVRRTGNNIGFWTVADGVTCEDTKNYINNKGEVSAYVDYRNKDLAKKALNLYLKKQIILEQTMSKIEPPEGAAVLRNFIGGATRDTDITKLDYEGFNNPLVDKCYAEYLNKHRQTANGLRDSDNWQTLFGEKHFDVCMKSLCRHVVDARLAHRGYKSEQPIIDSLNAVIFNAKAYLFKLLLVEKDYDAAIAHETGLNDHIDRIKPTPGGY